MDRHTPRRLLTIAGRRARRALARALLPWERAAAAHWGATPWPGSPIFLVGAPRTGSTILYQVVTAHWRLGYVTNAECRWTPANVLAARWTARRAAEGHTVFSSAYGDTEGPWGPSECGELWYRWFPRDRHVVGPGELPAAVRREAAATLRALARVKGMPLVIKNLPCGQRIGALAEIVPEALFVFCRRERLYTAQSILRARERLQGGDPERWWSVRPEGWRELLGRPLEEQVAAQVVRSERRIQLDLERHYPGRWLAVAYEELVADPAAVLRRLEAFLAGHGLRLEIRRPLPADAVRGGNRPQLPPERLERLAAALAAAEAEVER